METQNTSNLLEKFNNWMKESITIKLMSIGVLVLILLIPSSWIQSLMVERQERALSVTEEVADKWARSQTITGPVLVIPFTKREKIDKGKDGVEIREWTERAFFLPEKYLTSGKVKPEKLHRGIFDVAVYESNLDISALFKIPDFEKLGIAETDVLWKESSFLIGLSDLRGISSSPTILVGGVELTGEPTNNLSLSKSNQTNENGNQALTSEKGIVVKLPWLVKDDFKGEVKANFQLRGSSQLFFAPVGKTTQVSLEGPWPNPSFDGVFLPTKRDITESGFKAQWNILHYNRPFSQQWIEGNQNVSDSNFGVKFLIPVDQYQKSIRTAKYGQLIILLTFIALFMVEIMKKIRIHPFQYILIGSALIIYYTLLISFSEHIGYNIAYALSSFATVTLISLYSLTFLETKKLSALLTVLLVFLYGFIFVIIQLQDYSLLLGSVGLFAIIALVMYFSKNVKWYKE